MPTRLALLTAALIGIAPSLSSAADISIDTVLLSMDLTGTGVMPLGPGADWSGVQSTIRLGVSRNPASTGRVIARDQGGGAFQVSSFFDIFFDISFTDVDAVNDFSGQPDGASLVFSSNGPLHVESNYLATESLAPNMGLFPPPASAPYAGTFEMPLGADLNGNGQLDTLKFTMGLAFDDLFRSFVILPDGTVIDVTGMTATFSGSVVDVGADPPFGPLELTGPAAVLSQLTPAASVPEPSTIVLLGSGITAMLMKRRRSSGRQRPSVLRSHASMVSRYPVANVPPPAPEAT